MSGTTAQIGFWLMAALAVAGAVVTVSAREVMRMALGLAAFLLAVSGLFLVYGAAFLAAAQVFVYVGGVLVVLLFAIMVLRRAPSGAPDLSSRHDVISAAVCAMLAYMGSRLVLGGLPEVAGGTAAKGAGALAGTLLGGMLTQFELLGALLLVGLVAVVAISGGERK